MKWRVLFSGVMLIVGFWGVVSLAYMTYHLVPGQYTGALLALALAGSTVAFFVGLLKGGRKEKDGQ